MKNVLLFIVPIVAVWYFFDLGILKGEVTEYSLLCDKKNYVNYQCSEKWLPLNPSTYKPNTNKQQVIYWSHATPDISTLTKCSVVDRINWTCKYDDESAEFGFKNGVFWNISLMPSATDNLFEYKYVTKFQYRLEEFKWR